MRAINALMLLGLTAGVFPDAALAEIFKCKEADGTLTFSQTPCSKEEPVKVQTVAPGTTDDAVDCSHADKFAITTARQMRTGVTSDEVFDSYGGLDALSRGSVGVINYVYSFRTNLDVSAERIAGLTVAKCQAKGFGDVSCEALPYPFTKRLGGCNEDDEPEVVAPEQVAESMMAPDQQLEKPAPSVRAVSNTNDGERITQCKKKYRDEIDAIDAKMRSGYSSQQGERYREQLRALTTKLRACG